MTDRRHDANRVLGHSLFDELPEPRKPIERETRADFIRSFLVFAALMLALYALVLIGAGMAVTR